MPRGYNNYSFVIDSSFQPFTMQEMLVPFTAYKDAYEKTEEAYIDLSEKADKFKYLADTLDPDSKAAQIYNGYANDLKAQAEDLAHNGLSMGNRRALTNMRRRYQGEIGRLVEADTALQKEKELRRQMATKDPTMLYATDNLNIDSYLDNNTPNLYSVSGNDLYARGAAAGKAASARIYSDPQVRALDKYYNEYFSTEGYSPEKMQEFRDNLAAIPELQKAAMDIVKANRVGELGEGSANYNAALQQIINGIADGAIYQRQNNMQRNLGQLTAAEAASDARSREQLSIQREGLDRQAAAQGLSYDKETKTFNYDIRKDPKYAGELWKYDIDETTGQVKGYSEAYENAVAKGLTNAAGKNSKTTTPKQKPGTRKPKANVRISKNGDVLETTVQNGRRIGSQISYADAVAKYPKIALYVGEDSDLYDYFDTGSEVYIKGHSTPTVSESGSDDESTIIGEKNNQI